MHWRIVERTAMTFLRQVVMLTATGIRGIPQRLGASLVTVIGIATVVAVLISLLSIGEGVKFMSMGGVREDRAVVMSDGARFAMSSIITRAAAARIADAAGIRKAPDGTPLSAASTTVPVDLIRRNGMRDSIFMVGMTETGRLVFPELQVREGRFYRSGVRELIVSRSAQSLYRGLSVGERLKVRGGEWTVVGAFEDTGGVLDLTVIGDGDTVLSAFGHNAYQTVTVMLESPSRFGAFREALATDPSLRVAATTEAENRESSTRPLRGLLDFVSYFIGGVMASGAVFGALNSMFASVDSRRREIATLRAIGFGGGAVLISVLIEALVLAIPAAFLGTAIAWLIFNGDTVHTQGLTFKLAITPDLVSISIIWALVMALIGGAQPGLRAARQPVAEAMRAA
jgi:putative ABC transport system permease protein